MFRKIFGGKKNRDKRLSPSASTPEGLMQSHPMFQYAMKEYAQTVPYDVGGDNNYTSAVQYNNSSNVYSETNYDNEQSNNNDVGENSGNDGIRIQGSLVGGESGNIGGGSSKNTPSSNRSNHTRQYQQQQQQQQQHRQQSQQQPPQVGMDFGMDSSRSFGGAGGTASSNNNNVNTNPPTILRATSYKSTITTSPPSNTGHEGGSIPISTSPNQYHPKTALSPTAEYLFSNDDDEESRHHRSDHPMSQRQQRQHYRQHRPTYPISEPAVPDSTYEETYGDAYIGGPMRYVYPSGYQSMRPRSGPWKLSVVVCLIFTWLSVFVIGYCSDQADQYSGNQQQQQVAAASELDDDKLDIETKWCGSRLLYWMWVISMLITGLATAYCSVIGYIKLRDFAVANSRMQPTGHMGKSDYYVQLSDHHHRGGLNQQYQYNMYGGQQDHGYTSAIRFTNAGQPIHPANYSQTIYQADGSPQFWGNQIYRPTQAAVMITSR